MGAMEDSVILSVPASSPSWRQPVTLKGQNHQAKRPQRPFPPGPRDRLPLDIVFLHSLNCILPSPTQVHNSTTQSRINRNANKLVKTTTQLKSQQN